MSNRYSSDIPPALKVAIDEMMKVEQDEFIAMLDQRCNADEPKGDLIHWVPVLNRIDQILAFYIYEYGLDDEYPKLIVFDDEHASFTISCLNFTVNLLEHSTDKKLYSSSDRVYALLKATSFEVKLAALKVANLLAEKYCETESKKYAAPKSAKNHVLTMAKSYPPTVPPNFSKHIQDDDGPDADKPVVIGDHFSWIDTITSNKKYPSKWKQINFSYFRSLPKEDSKSKSPKKGEKQIQSEGLHTFSLTEDVVKKLSLQQILDKGGETIPKESWFEFALVAHIAKAFNSKSEAAMNERIRLLQMKCYAVGFVSCMCQAHFTSTRLFEAEPYIFTFLVDMINPENYPRMNEQTLIAATKSLEYIALKKSWGSDIIRCLNGNVSHGLLYQILRHINRQVKDNDPEFSELAARSFFSMIGTLISTRALTPRLTAGGILGDLLSFFNLRTNYRSTCSIAVHTTASYLGTVPQQFDEFADKNGFNLLIETIKYEVDFALENIDFEGGPPTEITVYYNITHKQSTYIKDLVKLVSDLIQSDFGDRLRNLFDSPLLSSFNKIILNPHTFGASILSLTLDCVFYIIHNEPTAFSILNEAGVIDTILNNYDDLFLPSANLLMSLPEVIGAICLNKDGMKKVLEKKTIETYMLSLINPKFAKQLVKSDMSTSLGSSFDELGRHHTSLKPVVLSAMKTLLSRFIKESPLNALKFYKSTTGKAFYEEYLEDIEDDEGEPIDSWELSDIAFSYDNLYFFLGGLIQDSQWGSAVIEIVDFEVWLSFLELEDAPFDYIMSNGFDQLTGILKFFDDENRVYGLPLIVNAISTRLQSTTIQEYLKFNDNDSSFFMKFSDDDVAGTKFLSELNVLNTLLKVLSSTYINSGMMFHERVQQMVPLFVDKGIFTSLCLLLERSIVEGSILRSRGPPVVEKESRPQLDINSNHPPLQVLGPRNSDDEDTSRIYPNLEFGSKFKNTLQLRFLSTHLQTSISKIFSASSRLCMHKRHDYGQITWRRGAVSITLEIGKALSQALDRKFVDAYLLRCYILAFSNISVYVMSHSERGKSYLHTPLTLALFQEDFFHKLKTFAEQIWKHFLTLPVGIANSGEGMKYISSSDGSISKNALSQVLSIFTKAVNSDSFANIPNTKLFFHKSFEKDAENKITSALLIQIRLVSADLIKYIIGSYSSLKEEPFTDIYMTMPTPIIEQIVKIGLNVYLGKKEYADAEFVPLTAENVSPPINQVNLLTSLGMTSSQAEHYFRHEDDIRNISKNNWNVCAQMNITSEEWEGYAREIASSDIDYLWTARSVHYRSSGELRYFRLSEKEVFVSEWIDFATIYPKAISVITEMFLLIYVDSKDIVKSVFDKLVGALDDRASTRTRKATISILGQLLKNERCARANASVFDKFRILFVEKISRLEKFEDEFLGHSLSIIEQMLVYCEIPQPEVTDHEDIQFHGPNLPYIMSEENKEQLFDTVLNTIDLNRKLFSNGTVHYHAARVLLLFSSDSSRASAIGSSQLFQSILVYGRDHESFYETFPNFNSIMIILLRRCFESTNVLHTYFTAEIANQFQPTRSRDLKSCLKEHVPLIFRDSQVYVDSFSKDVRLEDYNGGQTVFGRMQVERVKSKNESADVIMTEAESITNEDNAQSKRIDSSGIMHTLISELMSIIKSGLWLQFTEEQNEIALSDKKDKSKVFEDQSYSYAIFILSAIIELLASYKQCKLEFITFSKKKSPDARLKPTALNFFIYQLIQTKSLENASGAEYERRNQVSQLAKLAIFCLLATPLSDEEIPDPKKEDIDMAFIRRYFVDIVNRILKDTITQQSLVIHRYSKLFDIFELCGVVLSSDFLQSISLTNKTAVKFDQFYIGKAFSDRGVPSLLANILAGLDLNFPEIEKIVKSALKPITILGRIKTRFQEQFGEEHQGDKEEEDIVPEDEDEDIRDETPDLFRNSTLGMYDAEFDSEEEESDFYQDDGPLEVLLSEEDISDDGSSGLSDLEDLDDEDDEDDDEMLEEVDELDDENVDEDNYADDQDSDSHDDSDSADDIEIIDELDLDPEELRYGTSGEFYDAHGDDEAFLGAIRSMHDYEEMDQEDVDNEINHRNNRTRRDTATSFLESNEDSDEDLNSEISLDFSNVTSNRERSNSLFGSSSLRRATPALAVLLDSLGGIRASIEINGNEHALNGRNSLGRVFESILNRHDIHRFPGSTNNIYKLQSTRERWIETMRLFYPYEKDELALRVVSAIVNRIEEDSFELYKKKKHDADRARQEKEERLQKKKEEERLKREQEAKEREAEESFGEPAEDREPVMVRIGEREVDISGTDIDPEFFEALPDDMREEVFTQHVRERRANAARTGADTREIDPDFLAALPDQIREEILQQETFGEIAFDDGSFDEDLDEQPEEESDGVEKEKPKDVRPKKVLFTPLLEKHGVYSLVRLLFAPLTASHRQSVYSTLECICRNKQSRMEFLNLIIAIVHEGLSNQKSIEKIYSVICFKALGNVGNDQKDSKKSFKLPLGCTTLFVSIQIIEALDFILERNIHLRYLLLSEHDNPIISKKAKGSSSRDSKFPINYLLKLLENNLLKNDQTFMDILARVMEISTKLLPVLSKRQGKSFVAPIIPNNNYRQLIQILTANECSNATFRRTISAMQNLSVLPNAQTIFSLELSEQATTLGHSIIEDLQLLSKELKSEQDPAVLENNTSISKFSAASSDQSKLLRILTALDYMYESKEKEEEQVLSPKDNVSDVDEIEELTGLYKKLALGNLWDALSDCLRILQEKTESSNVATALLPLIEALMVVCKHSKVKDLSKDVVMKYEARRIDFSKEPIESLFFSFTDEHKKILNQMVRINPNLMSGPFGMLVKNPRVLEFDNKKNYFDRKLHISKNEVSKLSINIRREQVFLDSYRSLFFKSSEEFKKSKLEINFKGEAGVDAGGVTREWYQVLSRQMFNPDYALFTPVASDETTFHPNRTSYINPEHLSFFKFIGRIIGKAIFDGSYLDCHFSRAVYKRILGRPVSLKDMETLDLEYFKSLMWMLENDITDVITEDFSVETDDYGEHKIIDLIPDGRNIPVTELNKHEYVKKVVEYRLQTSVIEQMNNFLIGFHEIIPKDLISIFDEQELELLISGLPDINVIDWQQHTMYNNYSASSLQIQWFWRAVKSFDNEERAKLLQFATGTSKVPLNGFKELSGADGTCKFSIHRDYGSIERLPSSHTCFNQIDLPAYESYETLRGSLLLAITEGHEGFGLA
ncbi:E3 ubiquitin protein ligase TOM1 [Scheffersomyces coipomensis]|uniref:E3 ubiquitin protein ligase TOM1 n=1 Tax=Scheffersomyces coipomensis TaxID=1788519 RepID=UPI00315C546E